MFSSPFGKKGLMGAIAKTTNSIAKQGNKMVKNTVKAGQKMAKDGAK